MSDATVKGFIPPQLIQVNQHRPYQVRAIGLTFWCKMQIAAAVLLGFGFVMVGASMVYSLATGTYL